MEIMRAKNITEAENILSIPRPVVVVVGTEGSNFPSSYIYSHSPEVIDKMSKFFGWKPTKTLMNDGVLCLHAEIMPHEAYDAIRAQSL